MTQKLSLCPCRFLIWPFVPLPSCCNSVQARRCIISSNGDLLLTAAGCRCSVVACGGRPAGYLLLQRHAPAPGRGGGHRDPHQVWRLRPSPRLLSVDRGRQAGPQHLAPLSGGQQPQDFTCAQVGGLRSLPVHGHQRYHQVLSAVQRSQAQHPV